MSRRTALFGGSFNPPHNGHVEIARLAQKLFQLDRMVWMPCGGHPFQKAGLAPGLDRLMMALIAAATLGHEASTYEIEQYDALGSATYTVDTLRAFRAEEGLSPDELYLIVGMDGLRDLPQWKDPEGILAECRILAAERPGYALGSLLKLPLHWLDRITWFEADCAISSSQVRRALQTGTTPGDLVPPGVANYLQERGLYAP